MGGYSNCDPNIDDYKAMILNKFSFFLQNLVKNAEKPEHDLRQVTRTVEQFIHSVEGIENIVSDLAMKVYMLLFECETSLRIELYILILELLRDQIQVGQRLGKDIKSFIFQ